MAVRLDRGGAGVVFADVDHGPPFGELRAQLGVFLQTLTQAVEAFGHHVAGESGQRLRAFVDLDTGDDAGLFHDLSERHTVLGRLTDRLVVQDRAGDVLAQTWRSQQQLAVGSAVFFGVLDTDGLEALTDGVGRLINGDDAFARRDHRQGDAFEIFNTHDDSV